MLELSDLSHLGLPMRLARPVRVNESRIVAEGVVRPTIASKELSKELDRNHWIGFRGVLTLDACLRI